jgi:hypothetical protein
MVLQQTVEIEKKYVDVAKVADIKKETMKNMQIGELDILIANIEG